MQVWKGQWLQVCPHLCPLSHWACACPPGLSLRSLHLCCWLLSAVLPSQVSGTKAVAQGRAPTLSSPEGKVTSELSAREATGVEVALRVRLPVALDSEAAPGPRPLPSHWAGAALGVWCPGCRLWGPPPVSRPGPKGSPLQEPLTSRLWLFCATTEGTPSLLEAFGSQSVVFVMCFRVFGPPQRTEGPGALNSSAESPFSLVSTCFLGAVCSHL